MAVGPGSGYRRRIEVVSIPALVLVIVAFGSGTVQHQYSLCQLTHATYQRGDMLSSGRVPAVICSESKSQPDAGIGDRLAGARRRLAWAREELAFKAGISWSAIPQIKSGRRPHPRPATLSALASALGVTIDYL